MNAKELAEILNGCQIGDEVSREIEQKAKENNLVIVFGASDDLMEFRGAINDELDAYEGGIAYFDDFGLLLNKCDNDVCPYFEKEKQHAKTIKSIWCATKEYAWTFETLLPHFKFDVIEDDYKYCQGIVFSMANINQ